MLASRALSRERTLTQRVLNTLSADLDLSSNQTTKAPIIAAPASQRLQGGCPISPGLRSQDGTGLRPERRGGVPATASRACREGCKAENVDGEPALQDVVLIRPAMIRSRRPHPSLAVGSGNADELRVGWSTPPQPQFWDADQTVRTVQKY